jgi:hypothetical protein
MLNLNSQTLIQSEHGKFVIFKNSLNEFWDFCNGINMGANSLKASHLLLHLVD